jgi:hypothetical protein
MNNAANELAYLETQQAIEKLRNELYKLYWEAFGKEPKLEVLRAEAAYLVAKHGPNFELTDLLS